LPALTSRQGFSPVVCGPLLCPCRQSLEPPSVAFLATKRRSVGFYN
jgi:hypothetical protein